MTQVTLQRIAIVTVLPFIVGSVSCSGSKPPEHCHKTTTNHRIQAIENVPGEEGDEDSPATDPYSRITLEDGSKWSTDEDRSDWGVDDEVRLLTLEDCRTALQSASRLDEFDRPDTVEAYAVEPVSKPERW